MEALCNGLGYWGIHCIQVEGLNQLEEAFKTYHDTDLAFIGVNQGCEQQVAQVLHQQSMPCVLVSKWPIQDYEALGAQAFLFKPPSIQKLHDTVESLLNKAAVAKNHTQELNDLRNKLRLAKPVLLIAEDNPINRMLLNSMLAEKASIETVNDGKEAVTICNQKHFNTILLDLQMPNLNGLEAASLIHQDSLLNQKTPIILISANACDLNQKQLSQIGIDLWLQKPIDEKTLLSHLLDMLHKTESSPINWSLCLQKLSGNQTLATEFLACFVEELKKNRVEFFQLLKERDLQGLEQAAHRLNGASCFCGVPTLQHLVAHFETLAKQAEDIDELQHAFTELIQSIDDVIHEYETIYQEKKETSCQ